MNYLKHLCVFVLTIVLVGCGGGGGSESGGGAETSISINDSSLSFYLLEGEGTDSAPQTIDVDFKGDGVVVGYPPGVDSPGWLSVETLPATSTHASFNIRVTSIFADVGTNRTTLRFLTGKKDGTQLKYEDVAVEFIYDEPFHISAEKDLVFNSTGNVREKTFPRNGHHIRIHGTKSEWSASSDVSWISFNSPNGSGASDLLISVNPDGVTYGEHRATITVADGTSGMSDTLDVTFHARPVNTGSELIGGATNEFVFGINDYAVDEDNSNLYIADKSAKRIYLIDVASQKITKYFELEFSPEHFALSPDGTMLYVTLLTNEHSSYWWDEDQTGFVGVINLDSATVVNHLPIDIDPFGLAITDTNRMIVSPGSGQHGEVKTYDLDTLEPFEIGLGAGIYEFTSIVLHPDGTRLYASDHTGYPRSLERFSVTSAGVTSDIRTPHHAEYRQGKGVWITPDGDRVVAREGDVFNASDLTYFAALLPEKEEYNEDVIESLAFDPDNNRVIIISTDKVVTSHNLDSFELVETLATSIVDPRIVFIMNGDLYIMKYENGSYSLEVL